MSVIVTAHISDIHFGAFDSDDLVKELKYYFLKKIQKMPKLDLIVIQGDLYHYELSLNSRPAFNSFKFISKLQEIAIEKNAKIRVIKGTKSHDYDQLSNIKFNKKVDLKVINKVTVEEVYKGYRVLYLPEEYVSKPEEYYRYYFDTDEPYDMIIGHGMVEEVAFKKQESESNIKAAPIFKSDQLIDICKGLISFGHIHTAYFIKNKIFSTGSFSRWCQGEESPKGFFFSLYNTKNSNFRIIPVENKMARKYITKPITKIIMKKKIESLIEAIESFQIKYNIYKLRLKVHEINDPEFIFKLEILKKYFRDNKHIDLDINRLDLGDDLDEAEDLLEKYDYLFDDEIEMEEKVSIFIKDEFEYEMDSERVDLMINGDIIKTLNEKLFQLGNEV